MYTWLFFYNLTLLCFHLNNLCGIKKSVFSCKRNNKDNILKTLRQLEAVPMCEKPIIIFKNYIYVVYSDGIKTLRFESKYLLCLSLAPPVMRNDLHDFILIRKI